MKFSGAGRSIRWLVGASLAASAVFGFATSASAAIDDEQQAEWGLATKGPSRVIDRFDSLGWAVEEAGGFVFAGGRFLEVTNGQQTESQAFLAAFDRDTGVFVSTIRPDVGGTVLALEPSPDGALFVGGEMDEWNGQTIGALAKIDPATGDLVPGFTTRLFGDTSVVRDLSMGPDGFMYAAGTFTTASFNGVPGAVESVVRFDPVTGAIDWSWVPETDGGAIWGVSRSYTEDVVYISGWDNVRDGSIVIGVDSADPSIVVWDAFVMNFGCCNHMYDIQATPAGTVLAVGEQHGAYLYDESNNWAQIAGHTTAYDSRYQANSQRGGGDYQDIELSNDGTTLYASCHCWGSHSSGVGFTPTYSFDLANVTGTHTGRVSATIAYDSVTGVRDQTFNPYMAGDSGGWGVLEASDGCIWIAGGINAVGPPGDQTSGRDLARLCEEGYVPPNDLEPPATCLATIGVNDISVSWPGANGAADYVISRSVDGGTIYWRGVSAAAPFIDTLRGGTLVYQVQTRSAAGVRSDPTICSIEDETPTLTAPAECSATVNGNAIDVSWPTAAGADQYVIFRTVNGGAQSWRGRVATTTFVDTNRSADLVYFVASRSATGELSARTECTLVDNNDPIMPVASCTVSVVGDVATITWTAAPGADAATEYIVYRSVDGGNEFWRGRTAVLSFDDQLRTGDITYLVATKQGSDTSDRTTCEPVV